MTRPWRTFVMISIGVFASLLDLFIVNIAFPDLQRDFAGSGLAGLSWVLNGYAIVFAALLVPAGRLADLYGRRRGFVAGLALFVLASAACAVAPSAPFLIAARLLQGAGAAILTPSSLGVVLPVFAPNRRPVVIAAWAAVGAAFMFFAAFAALLLSGVLFLTQVWGHSILRAGLELAAGPLAALVFAPVAGRIGSRIGMGPVGAAGGLLVAAGLGYNAVRVGLTPDYAGAFLP